MPFYCLFFFQMRHYRKFNSSVLLGSTLRQTFTILSNEEHFRRTARNTHNTKLNCGKYFIGNEQIKYLMPLWMESEPKPIERSLPVHEKKKTKEKKMKRTLSSALHEDRYQINMGRKFLWG